MYARRSARAQELGLIDAVVSHKEFEWMAQGRLPRRRGHVTRRGVRVRNGDLCRPARLDHGTGQSLEHTNGHPRRNRGGLCGRSQPRDVSAKSRTPACDRTSLPPHVAVIVEERNESRVARQRQELSRHAARMARGMPETPVANSLGKRSKVILWELRCLGTCAFDGLRLRDSA